MSRKSVKRFFPFHVTCAKVSSVRAVALLGPYAQPRHLKRFAIAGVSLWPSSELHLADESQAALIFGGDGTLHRHLGGLVAKQIPVLVVPIGSANDFAKCFRMACNIMSPRHAPPPGY